MSLDVPKSWKVILPFVSRPLRYLKALFTLQKLEEKYLTDTKYFEYVRDHADKDFFFTPLAIREKVGRWDRLEEITKIFYEYVCQGIVARARITSDIDSRTGRNVVEGYRIPQAKMKEVQDLVENSPRDWPID